jgi:hypothetical protein
VQILVDLKRFEPSADNQSQFFWAFWPSTYKVDGSTFNWACPLFLLFIGCALLIYWVHAEKTYQGPVTITDAYTP